MPRLIQLLSLLPLHREYYLNHLRQLPLYPANTYGNLPPAINFGTTENPIPIRSVQVVIFAVSVVIVAILTYFINRTKYGKAMQAIAEDPTTASLLGINSDRFIILTFFISSFLAGLAGTLVASSVSIAGPYFGIAFGLRGLAVIVLGGLDRKSVV